MLLGAAIGAGFAFLFLTKGGQRFLGQVEPWLDDVIRDMHRFRDAAAKAREAVEEGKKSFTAVSKLRPFGQDSDNRPSESRH
jgi:hypothetical protein